MNSTDGSDESATSAFDRQSAEVLLSALRQGSQFGEVLSPAEQLHRGSQFGETPSLVEQLEARVVKASTTSQTTRLTAAPTPATTTALTSTLTPTRLPRIEERPGSTLNTKKMLEVTMRHTAGDMRQKGDKGIGIDVEPVSTFKNASQTFIVRNFTNEEQLYCKAHANPAAGFAGRWAAKEAVIKAISSTAQNAQSLWRGGGAPLKDIAILPSTSGAPAVELRGHAKEVATALGVSQVQVSISHAADHAVAQAIAR